VDSPRVSRAGDDAIQSVNLAHEVALAETADGRIAAHRPDRVEIKAHQRRSRAHPGRRAGSFHPGVTAADDDDIEGMHDEAQIGPRGRIVKDDSRVSLNRYFDAECFT
jgi:hypothetical protein